MPTERAADDGLKKGEKICLALCTALCLIPIWLFTYFPTQDGPAHIENAVILTQYHTAGGAFWHQYYLINSFTAPNWLDHLALAALSTVLSPLIAEKFFLTGYIVGLVLAFAYALTCFNRSALFATALIFPFLFNHLFHMGFYSYSCSFIPYLVLLGYFYRHRSDLHRGHMAVFFLLAVLVYLFHPIAFVMAFLFVFTLCAIDTIRTLMQRGKDRSATGSALLRRCVPLAIMLCILALVIRFANTQPRGDLYLPDLIRKMKLLFSLSFIVSYDYREYYLTALLAALFAVLLLRGGKRLLSAKNRYRDIGAGVLAYLILYAALPEMLFSGGLLSIRVGLFLLLLFMLWLAANHDLWRLRFGVQACAYAVTIGLLISHVPRYFELDDYLREYVSAAAHIRPDSTLLPVSFEHRGRRADGVEIIATQKVSPFLHAAGYIAAARRVVEFTNYEASTGYFPLVFRAAVNPYVHLGDPEGVPTAGYMPSIRSLEFPGASGGSVDYILVWGRMLREKNGGGTGAIMDLIKQKYVLVHVSRPRGLAELWRRK